MKLKISPRLQKDIDKFTKHFKPLVKKWEAERSCIVSYKIVRFYKGTIKQRTIQTGLTLEEAKAHRSSPKSEKEEKWFDGFVKE